MEIDWKKKYEEALNKARELHGTVAAGRDFLAEIFPELCESEDERIRKAIIELLKEVGRDDTGISENAKCMIAYLERHKYSPMPEDTVIFQKGVEEGRRLEREDMEKERLPIIETYQRSWYTEGYYDGKLKKEPRWIIKTQGICTKYEENPKYGQSLEEEHKPAEKQDYSDLNGLERAIHRGFLSAGVENAPVTIIRETAQECLAQKKPAEWSEEDERMLSRCIKSVESSKNFAESQTFKEAKDKEKDWLKSLPERFNLQLKQEWSDEDILYYNAVMEMVMYSLYLPSRPRNEVIKWLKSLKNRGNSPKSNTNSPYPISLEATKPLLEKEIENYYYDNFAFISSAHTPTKDIVSDIATHFYELGQRRVAEMYDEVEYSRQRADEEMSDKTLDEAAEEYGRKEYSHAIHFWDEGLSKNKPEVMKEDFVDSFKAGAKWMAGQGVTLKITDDTTWGEVNDFIHRNCDGVKEIQIRKKEEK